MTIREASPTQLQTYEIRTEDFPLLNFPVSWEQLVNIIEFALASDLTLQQAKDKMLDIEIAENRVEKEKLGWPN